MGMFDDVTLSEEVALLARAQYSGKSSINVSGWQSKCLECSLLQVKLAADGITVAGKGRPNITGAVRFYQMTPSKEWIEFVAVYVDGKLVAIRHVDETK